MTDMLSDDEFLRYGRQILLPELGEAGQQTETKQSADCRLRRAGFSSFTLSGGSRCRSELWIWPMVTRLIAVICSGKFCIAPPIVINRKPKPHVPSNRVESRH